MLQVLRFATSMPPAYRAILAQAFATNNGGSDDSLLAQSLDVAGADAEPVAEDFRRVLAQQMGVVDHGPRRDPSGPDQAHCFVLVVPPRPIGDHLVDLGFMPAARLSRRIARIVQ